MGGQRGEIGETEGEESAGCSWRHLGCNSERSV